MTHSSLLLFTEHVSQTLNNAVCDAEYRAFLCPRIELYQNEISCSFEPVSIATELYTCDVQAEAVTTSELGRMSRAPSPPWKAEVHLWWIHGTYSYMLPMCAPYIQSFYSGLPYLHLVNKYKYATYMKLNTCKNSIYSCPEGRLSNANMTQNKSLCLHLLL